MGASGATTLIFKGNKFVISGTNYNSMTKEQGTAKLLIEKLKPENGDVIIIGSAVDGIRIAEFAAKNAALLTIANHEKHI
jgi:hypothetical protein